MANIIEMPKLSDTMTVGTLVKWLKNEGDAVKSGDMLAEVETDKATMELESFFDGTLVKIFAPAGSQVAIGAALCAIGEKGEKVEAPASEAPASAKKEESDDKSKDQAKAESDSKAEAKADAKAEKEDKAEPKAKAEAKPEPKKEAAPEPKAKAEADDAPAPEGRLKISPLARKLATMHQLDPRRITGSGPHGRIVKADILAAAADPTLLKAAKTADAGDAKKSAAPAGSFTGGTPARTGPIQEERTVAASNMRATIARRLLEAKTQIPHFYLEIEVDAAPLLALRTQLNEGLAADGVKLSVNDFVLKASAEALRRVPGVNASWTGTGIQYHGAAHVSFAVAIDDGLITPVIRDTHQKSVFAISTEAKALGKRAKDKKLKPDEFTGGTFCVSNLGMFGVSRFSAIINPPNSAILAVGTTVEKPVVVNGQLAVGQRMSLTLSCDHRVVDGALGAQYLSALRQLLEAPALLLV
jgi:pyruvate dehydrogenase E2 component (dihydrolipoamide acetyltransferase)